MAAEGTVEPTEDDDAWARAVERRRKKPPPPRVVVGGGDPVLRLALIEAGVISYVDLAMAEEKFRNAQRTGTPAVAGEDDRVSNDARSTEEDPRSGHRDGA